MDTMRVDVCYRPLRIAWAIHSGDKQAFRRAVRLSHTMWGGRFNPIVMADRHEAHQLIGLFRVDVIIPLGDSKAVKEFPHRFPYLINPFFPHDLFLKDGNNRTSVQVLDIHNALVHWRDTSEWKALTEQGIRRFCWAEDDPLADTFLMQYGAYPDVQEIGIDYLDILSQAAPLTINSELRKDAPITPDVLEHSSIAYLTRHGLYRHYTIQPAWWGVPGFFVGDVSELDDLVYFWNLRATDISVNFIDPAHIQRYELIRPELEKRFRARLSHLDEPRNKPAIWAHEENLQDALKLFDNTSLIACRIDAFNMSPPLMILGEESSLGVVGDKEGKPKVSFALRDKPFCGDTWFHTQHLVASVSLGRLYGDEQHTFQPPYVPELNEFLARTMHCHYAKLRAEPERIGLIIDAADHDSFLYALPVAALVEKLFSMIGLKGTLSPGGLITRQLISRLGGVEGARVFKIPGVRRLLKTYGPTTNFTRKAALSLIGSTDPENPQARFKDHKGLFIEARPMETELRPETVFAYLVEKGLFRIGAELICPACNLPSWVALDVLKQKNICDLCGAEFDATRQLVNGVYHYRRSGLLGLEKNAQGAVPVALALQQLTNNLSGFRDGVYTTSYEVKPNSGCQLPECEIDFLLVIPRNYPKKAEIILGECKDKYEGNAITSQDVEHLRQIADALPPDSFDTYIAFTKLAPFTSAEIAFTHSLNGRYQCRVILLTARELEPYFIYGRTKEELGIESHGGSPEDLAHTTSRIYFTEPEKQS